MPHSVLIAGALLSMLVAPLGAGAQALPGPGDTATVIAGPQYRAGRWKTKLLGENHRALWTVPVRVPVLNPERFGGGLTPLEVGGGLTTESLRLRGADGREYVFRSVDKNVAPALPEVLRGTLAERIVQDAISAQHPAAALVAAPLLEAAGVLHVRPQLYVMPDHPFLDTFRDGFAGRLGQLEERPDEAEDKTPDFAAADEVEGTEDFLDDLEDDPRNRVDGRAYLTTRLMDLLLGDWDRHADQWRWARFDQPDGLRIWRPIPRDRDNALVSHEGLLYVLARGVDPRRVRFGPEYGDLKGLLMDAELDRRLLSELPRPAWDSVATALRARLTDRVIEDAVGRIPPEYRSRGGPELVRALQGRRDRLLEAAAWFYTLLADEVEVHATDADEQVRIERHPDGSVDVEIRTLRSESGAADGRRSFFRRFDPTDTREIRVFLQGGNDRASVRGNARRSPRVRIIGGGGDDLIADSSRVGGVGRRTVIHDHRGDNRIDPGSEAAVDRLEPLPLARADSVLNPNGPPPRDWGTANSLLVPYAGWQPNAGPVLGFGPVWIRYGFRRQPYARMAALRLLWAPYPEQGYGAEALYDRRWTNSLGATRARVRATGFEATRFHGFGNDTPERGDRDRFVVSQTQALGEVLFDLPLVRSGRIMATIGPIAKWTSPDPKPGSIASEVRPRGVESFAQLGALAGIRAGTWDAPLFPQRGFRADLQATGYAWDDGSPFGAVRTESAGYLPVAVPLRPTLAVRVGGMHALGEFPFQEGAYLGGAETVRGFATGRFVGETATYGSAELHAARLARVKLLVRGDLGAFLLADAGRVYVGGESGGGWHTGLGGGVLFTTLGQVFGLTYAHGDAHRLYLHAGVPF